MWCLCLCTQFQIALDVQRQCAWNPVCTRFNTSEFFCCICSFQASCVCYILVWILHKALYIRRQFLTALKPGLCNTLLVVHSVSTIRSLHLIHYAGVQILFNLSKYIHVSTLVQSLHWLTLDVSIIFNQAKPGPDPLWLSSNPLPCFGPYKTKAWLYLSPFKMQGWHASQLFISLESSWWNDLPVGDSSLSAVTSLYWKESGFASDSHYSSCWWWACKMLPHCHHLFRLSPTRLGR